MKLLIKILLLAILLTGCSNQKSVDPAIEDISVTPPVQQDEIDLVGSKDT